MDPERWRRIEALLDAALDLPAAERAGFLATECTDDPTLAAEVTAILTAGEAPDAVLDHSAARFGASVVAPNDETPVAAPGRVGAYRIERVLGEGGMGTVYLAHRDDGEFEQRVALKLVRRGLHLDSRIVQRFRDERRILAALEHPGIARLLDGGLTSEGLPYFAMEYVAGLPIDRYCETHGLALEGRLRLFGRVCDAVAHAHGKQVVHRDIKPSNILVTNSGEPRLLDFGIAKLIIPDGDSGARPALTRRSERLLTPEYASPEQIRGEAVTAATDVYGLGVLLYELLTGHRPFRRAERSAHALERAVLEDDPTRPSDVATRDVVRRRLKGDLDTIILTAMAKEPERRYRSAAELGDDVRRHLAGTPVLARGSSPVYRMRRWARRHRVVLGAAAVVAVTSTVIAAAVLRPTIERRLVPGIARRVVFEPELALDGALSPDGRRIAFVAGTETAPRLYVKDLGSERVTPLGDDVPGLHRWPRWSPDGRRLALLAGSRLYEVPSDGSAARALVSPGAEGAVVAFAEWSPDGMSIAYMEDGAVFIRPAAGGSPRRVAPNVRAPHSLSWSPDGELIAVVSGNIEFVLGTHPAPTVVNLGNAGPASIWVVPVRGGAAIPITDNRALNTSPVWLSGGRTLLYVSNRDGPRDVYRMELDRSGRPVGEAQRVTTGLDAHTISVSRDGGLLAYSTLRLTTNIWSVSAPRDGSGSDVEASRVTRGQQSVEGLALSADGRWLAFDSNRAGNHDIYRVAADGGEATQVTSGRADEFMPHWSPDASEIAFHAFQPDGTRRLEVVSAEGGVARPVAPTPRNQRRPAWAPNGRSLVFESGHVGGSDLYLVARTGAGSWGPPRHLTSDGGAARWSPDGREILYVGRDGIRVTTPAGGPGRLVVPAGSPPDLQLGNAEWSPDGARILFKRFDGEGRTSFWSVEPHGGVPQLVAQVGRGLQSTRPEFATDGRRFYFTVTERASDIWTMELRADPR
ncbi:MAG TPA: protein kinase [Gemmatimonadaceae bacterium]|nr:protein kinase [Gemmatimonadaceae bacterium]